MPNQKPSFAAEPAAARTLPTYDPVTVDDVAAVVRAMTRAPLTTIFGGFEVGAFEREFADRFGSTHAIAVSSGTAALVAALRACGVSSGDEVIVTPLGFVASVSAVIEVGAIPVFADISPDTYTLDPQDVEQRISPRTKVLLPVHHAGHPADMNALTAIARHHKLKIVEDCAPAHGARVGSSAVGTIGDIGCFSFSIGKIVRAGEGGMLTTDNDDYAARLRAIRVNGLVPGGSTAPRVDQFGSNYTMPQLSAALGRSHLSRFTKNSARRESISRYVIDSLEELPVTPPAEKPWATRAYYSLPFRVDPRMVDRDALVNSAQRSGIPISAGNPQLLYEIEYIADLVGPTHRAVAQELHRNTFYFDPLPAYSDSDVSYLAGALRRLLTQS